MDYSNPIFVFFLGSVAMYGFTLFVAFIFKRTDMPKANTALALMVMCYSLYFLYKSLEFSGAFPGIERYRPMIGLLWFILPPLLYIHALFLIKPETEIKIWWMVHLIPAVLHLINLAPFYVNLDAQTQMDAMGQGIERTDFLYQIMTSGVVFPVQVFIYHPLCVWVLRFFIAEHKEQLGEYHLKRLRYFRNGYTVIMLTSVSIEILNLLSISGNWFIFAALTYAIVIFGLAFISLQDPAFLLSPIRLSLNFRSHELPEEESLFYETELIKRMEAKDYQDPELTLQKLSTSLNLQPRQLSALIKKRFGKSSTEFLNFHRVEAAKQLLIDPKHNHWSVFAVGMEVGFNSKSTFNRVFKNIEGKTPSEYRKSVNKTINNENTFD